MKVSRGKSNQKHERVPLGEEYWRNRPLEDKQRDWEGTASTWIEEYIESVNHPHRQLILQALRKFESFVGVLEVGCGPGANLRVIQDAYPETQLAGVDVNTPAITRAQELVPKAILKVARAQELPFEEHSFDIAIADALLMYVPPADIETVIHEFTRVTRRGIIILDWFADSFLGEIINGHWARDYTRLLESFSWVVTSQKLTVQDWPTSESWIKRGFLYVSHHML